MSLLIRFSLLLIMSGTTILNLPAQTPFDQATRKPDVMASWPDCDPGIECTRKKLDAFIAKNLVIPAEAREQNAGGMVMVEFVVEKNGTIGEIRTLHDPGYGLGTAASNVIAQLRTQKIKWKPALEKGKKIPSRFMTPVSFNLGLPPEALEKPVPPPVPTPDVYEVAEVMPVLEGCEQNVKDTVDCTFRKMLAHIQSNLTYPDSARKMSIQGPVVVEFIVDKTGKVTSPKVTRGLGHGLDEEALRVISLLPAWKPGMQDGQPVNVRMVVPIQFQIPKPEQE